jgi:hypothetical protein
MLRGHYALITRSLFSYSAGNTSVAIYVSGVLPTVTVIPSVLRSNADRTQYRAVRQ